MAEAPLESCDRPPKLSVGLAVYNGEPYLRAAIDSILAQTFTDFELIISDNASTDQTETICHDYAAQDSRIRYHRNLINIGGIHNENLTLKLAKGAYFRLAAHDDLLAPELFADCIEYLDAHPETVLCYSITTVINAQNHVLETVDRAIAHSSDPMQRFRQVLSFGHTCEASYGVMRVSALQHTELQPNYPESDFGFLAELSLYGRFHQLPKPLFYRRIHDKQMSGSWNHALASTDAQVGYAQTLDAPTLEQFKPAATDNPTTQDSSMAACSGTPLATSTTVSTTHSTALFSPLWFMLRALGLQGSHFIRVLLRAPLSPRQRLVCVGIGLRFILWRILIVHRDVRQRFGLTKATWRHLWRGIWARLTLKSPHPSPTKHTSESNLT
jgi:hypothetical protein